MSVWASQVFSGGGSTLPAPTVRFAAVRATGSVLIFQPQRT